MSSPAELFSKSLPPINTHSVTDDHGDEQESLWKKELANATTSVSGLLEKLKLEQYIKNTDSQSGFRCLVTESYLDKIEVGNVDDPLLLQVLPSILENDSTTQEDGLADPVGDLNAQVTQGLLHKYHGRALLINTGACAIHCRYCFRRAYPYQESSCTSKTLNDALTYLNGHTEIEEIILSGGDPLVLDNNKLSSIINKLEDIKHIRTLRIHTRIPVVLPNRITSGLLQLLQTSTLQVVMVIHTNHANELQSNECAKLRLLHQAGIILLNQSVLLKNVNDNTDALIALSKRLFDCKTLPYYLHLLDPVKGAMHFKTDKISAQNLIRDITAQLPGYLVPKLVQEIAGSKSKTAIFHI